MYWNLWNALHLALSRVKVLHFQILTQNQRLFQKSFFGLKRSRHKLILKISPWGFMNIELQFYSKLQFKTQLYFLCLSVSPKVCSIIHQEYLGRIQNEKYFMSSSFFFNFHFCVVFHHKICVFITFIYFFWWSIKFLEQNYNQSKIVSGTHWFFKKLGTWLFGRILASLRLLVFQELRKAFMVQ